jgi:hypothetical protein
MAGSFAVRQSKTILMYRKSDRSRDDLCAVGLRKRVQSMSFRYFESNDAAPAYLAWAKQWRENHQEHP